MKFTLVRTFLLPILALVLFLNSVPSALAEITHPYTVDEKPQVLFGDSPPVSTYYGLENYTHDYVNGYAHITFTYTHHVCCYAGYPPQIYLTDVDPRTIITPTWSSISTPYHITFGPTDWYLYDIQFDATGYTTVVKRAGADANEIFNYHTDISDLTSESWVSLANQYPIFDPILLYSMSFMPMRLVENPPSKILSFDISTDAHTATVHDYISTDDVGADINFTIGTSTNGQWYISSVIATTTGDFYYTWNYPELPATLTGFQDYNFYTDITKSGTILKSKNLTMSLSTPVLGFPGYSSLYGDESQRVESSYNYLIQTLGTHLQGTLSRIDIQTSNPSHDYYGSRPYLNLYQCDDSTYGGLPFGSGCLIVYNGLSDTSSAIGTSTQSFYPDPIVFNPSKYYFLESAGNNQLDTLPYYYGSRTDTVDGSCLQYKQTPNAVFPCATISDLYFRLYGISKLSLPPASVGNSNVLFLPGLEASRLYRPSVINSSGEVQLWEPHGNGDVEGLYLNTDGTSLNSDIYTRDIIKETNTPIPLGPLGQNIYKSFSTMMDGLVASDKIIAWQSYAYDWRKSVQDIVDNGTQREDGKYSLVEALQALSSASRSGKVTIIAHSNGGLIAKALLKKLEGDKLAGRNTLIDNIDTVILVASPQWGTPTAIPAILHGYDQDLGLGILMNRSTARELGRNMAGAYGLLPSAEYFNHVLTPVVTFVPNYLDTYMSNEITNYGQAITSSSTQKNFLLGTDARPNPGILDTLKPIKAVASLLTQAENLHSSIDTMTVPTNIRIVQIAGWGLDTIAGFQYNASTTCSYATDNGCTGNYILDERPIFTADGDKTVVTPSALAMSGEKYWVDFRNYNTLFRINREHKDILEVDPLNNSIKSILQKEDIVLDNVFKNVKPIDTSNRLHLSLHSPVTLDAYDSSGNHTGKICPSTTDLCYTVENIPNSGYYEFGEGKYINLPQDALQEVVFHGTDIGTFTFESQVVDPGGQTSTTSFVDIPVTTQTQATSTINSTTGTIQLTLDVTGDGVTDFTLGPSTTFDPVIYLQIMRATIDSLDLTQAKKNVFDKRVDNIIKLIQKGKVDKAKLKADKFKTVLENRLSKPDPKHPKPKKLSKTDAQLLLDMLNGLLDNLS